MKRREELDKYRDLSEEELRAEAARLQESLFRLKFKLALGEVDAVKRIRLEKNRWRVYNATRQRQPQEVNHGGAGAHVSERNHGPRSGTTEEKHGRR